MNRLHRVLLRVAVENLESRRMMTIYSATDYFPLPAVQNWTYQSTVANQSAIVKRTSAVTTFAGQSVVQFHDKTTSGGITAVVDRIFRHDGAGGLRHYRMDFAAQGYFYGAITYSPAMRILPQTFETGTVGNWSSQAVNATFTIPSLDNTPHAVSGTDRCSSTVLTAPDESRAGFTFFNVIKLDIAHEQHYTASINGSHFNIEAVIDESCNLARGVGMISGNTTLSISVTGPGVNYSQTFSETNVLMGSSLLTSFTRVTGSTLRVGGTTGNDVISAGLSGDQILVVRNDIGVQPAAVDDITRLVIDGAAGNDSIGNLNIGRMRTILIGNNGNDTISGSLGRDLIYGGAGNDILMGYTGIDTIFGDAGNDLINGHGGADYIDGGDGTDTIRRDDLDIRVAVEVLVG